jgi:FKBP-type peptidyl-prolyl cis-trans isomerase SlyD
MIIAKNSVVTFEYSVKDKEGAVLDSSPENEPLEYLHGYGQVIEGVESALDGKKKGDLFDFSVGPKEGYGEYDERLLLNIQKDKIEGDEEIEVGMPVTVRMKGGERVFRIARITDNDVVLDGNHPFAGLTLFFNVAIRDVREATPEELEHAHSHEHGGCDCGASDCGESDCGDCR